MDEVQEDDTFLGILKSWFTMQTSAVTESRPALARFIQEFLAGDQTIFDRTQESRLFFSGLAPNQATNSIGVPLMDFMQPSSVTIVSKDRCLQCQIQAGYVRPGNLATNVAFDIHMPAERAPNESIQTLINHFFNTQRRVQLVDCVNPQCRSQVNVATYTEIVDPKEGVIIHIDRFLPTPENDIRGITGKHPHSSDYFSIFHNTT